MRESIGGLAYRVYSYCRRITRYELEFIDWLILVIASLAVLNPFTDVYTNGKAYDLLRMAMPEHVLGGILFFVMLSTLFSMHTGDRKFRLWMTGIQAVIWVLLFGAFLAVNLTAFFPWFLSVFALCSIIPFTRLSRADDIWTGHQ